MTTHRKARSARSGALVVALVGALVAPAAVAAQEYPTEPPPPAPLAPAQFPPFQEARLANGIDLVVVESHEQPVVSISLAIPAGSAHDPVGREGMADLVAGLLTKGAGGRSAEEIAATIEGVGGSLGASAGADFLTTYANVLTPNAQLAFDLVADVVARPTFPIEEVELARTQTLSGLQLQLSQPAALATRFFNQNLYGEHPYARSATPETVRAVTRDEIVAWQKARLRPEGALLVVAGDISLADARRMAERSFAGWTGAAPAAARSATPPQRTATGILLVHRPGSVQSNIVVGNVTFGPADPLRYATTVANQVLGGGADSRLFLVLREQKGWTYGAYSSMSRPLGPGAFRATAEVRTEVTDSALVEMLSQLRRLRSETVPAAELDAARGALVGSFPLTIETAQQIAGAVSQARLLGLGTDYLHEYRNRLAAVSAADLQKAAQAAIRPDSALIVVVGDGAKLYESLSRIAPVRIVSPTGDAMTPDDLVVRGSSVKLDPSRLKAGRDSFVVLVQGNPFGHTVTEVARATDGGVTITESTQLGPVMQQTTTVTLTPALEPLRVEQSGRVQGQATKVDVTYANGRVTGTAATPGMTGITEKTVDAEVPEGVIDDNTLATLLPILPWAADAKLTLPVFASGQGQLQQITLAVTGVESVTVPAGTFQAFRVEATGGQAPLTFLIEQAAPHRLLKIQPTGQPLEIVRAK
ncbi:MAG TPA: insulinase family protein [Gemmatimonadales bacterium]